MTFLVLVVLETTVTTGTLSAFPGDRYSSVFVNSAAKICRLLSGCHPLDGVTHDGLPLLVTPLTNSLPTGHKNKN